MSSPRVFKPSNSDYRLWLLLFRFISSDWTKAALQAWDLLKKISSERTVGLYEVLDFDHTLELCDLGGKKAIYHKRETVRFLQDFVTAYQDQAWGLGNIFADYKCSPGAMVDRYRDGHKYRVLISLRETKRRDEIMRIRIDHTVHNGFTDPEGWSETEITHRTKHLRTSVTFPKTRHCKKATLIEENADRSTPHGPSNIEPLPDGRPGRPALGGADSDPLAAPTLRLRARNAPA
jgi:hypothetical protein